MSQNKRIYLKIVGDTGLILEEELEYLKFQSTQSEFGLTPNHSPMIATIEPGKLELIQRDVAKTYFVPHGLAYVEKSKVSIMTQYMEEQDKIDLHRANKAMERAKKRLSLASSDTNDLARARKAHQRAAARILLKKA